MTLPRNVRAIRALYVRQNVLLELNMQKSLVVNPHTLGSEYRAFISIDMVHKLDILSGDSTQRTLARTELGSKLTKSGIYLINHKKLVRRRSRPSQFWLFYAKVRCS